MFLSSLSFAVDVSDYASLKTQIETAKAAGTGSELVLTMDVALPETLTVEDVPGLIIEGRYFEVDGQASSQCMKISGATTSVDIAELTITNGFAAGDGQIWPAARCLSADHAGRPTFFNLIFLFKMHPSRWGHAHFGWRHRHHGSMCSDKQSGQHRLTVRNHQLP